MRVEGSVNKLPIVIAIECTIGGWTGAGRAHVTLRLIEKRVEFSARQALERDQVAERSVAAPLLIHEFNSLPAASVRE